MSDLPASFVTATNAISNGTAPKAGRTGDPSKIDAAAKDFEAFFLSQVLENMFAGIRTDGIFGGGHGESVFRSFMLQEYGKVIANQGGIGLSDAVKRDMLRMQEVQ